MYVDRTFLIFLAALVVQTRSQLTSIGNCNLTAFTGGGQKCQRDMIIELKNNNMTNCSIEYANEETCLSNHVDMCVRGNLIFTAVKGQITKLLLLLLYHCGNINSNNVQEISDIVFREIRCNRAALGNIGNCWNDFRSAFEANKSDSSLCRKYAEAKRNCANIAREACEGICSYIPKDEYNPFCSNHTDPPGTSELFDCILTLGCAEKVVYEEAVKCEKLSFKDFAENPQDCSVELKKRKDCLRNSLVSRCPAVKEKPQIFDDVENYLRGNLMAQRFFCNKVEVNSAVFHRSVKAIVNCQSEFFADAENCAEPFRKAYAGASKKKSPAVCTAFSEAKKCLNNAHEKRCSFNDETKKAATFDNYNPFCEDGKDPQQQSGRGRDVAAAVGTYLFFYSIVLYFLY